jgi:putative PIN family toxin of toxin-antitoxin system
MKPRAVLDANTLVSGLLGGTATKVIKQWRDGAFILIVSEEIMAEYEEVLTRPKFKLPEWVVQELLGYIREHAEWVTPNRQIQAVDRAPSDNKFLEAAVSGYVNWLVSGDKDLLDLGEFEGIPVIPSCEFLHLV